MRHGPGAHRRRRRRPLTENVVRALNPQASLPGVRDDVAAIGYP
ncbi:hypothetical protein [Dactylosporangium sp. CA-139066]